MKIAKVIKLTAKTLGFLLLGVILLVVGTIVAVYSPWVQDSARIKLVEVMNRRTGVDMSLDRFRLSFPLDLSLEGLCLANQGDTLIAAGRLDASVALLPLLKGEAQVKDLALDSGRFVLGGPDSAMYMVVEARSIALQPVKVRLSDMDIEAGHGTLDGLTLDMVISPDTVPAPADTTKTTAMSIRLDSIDLRDFTYKMSLLPTIDSLGVNIATGKIAGALIDLSSQNINVDMFAGDSLSAAYIAPPTGQTAAPVAESADSLSSAPWTIRIDSISFDNSKALYTARGTTPMPGFDPSYIEVDSLGLYINDFYNRATTIVLPLRLNGRERCGVDLAAEGVFRLDSAAMWLDSLKVTTATTELTANMMMGQGDMTSDPSLPLSVELNGAVGVADLRKMFPAMMPYLVTLPVYDKVETSVEVAGTPSRLDINRLAVGVNGVVNVNAKGYVGSPFEPAAMNGDMTLSGKVLNVNGIKNSIMGREASKDLNIPRMNLNGHVRMRRGVVDGNVKVATGGGDIKLDGKWNSRGEDYNANFAVNKFPIQTFMPNLGAEDVTASLNVDGHGYNPFSQTMKADATLTVDAARYNDYTYRGISLSAAIADGHGEVRLLSDNPDLDLSVEAEGNLTPQPCVWTLNAEGREVDLEALKFSTTESKLSFALSGDATINNSGREIEATLKLKDLEFTEPASRIEISNVLAKFNTNDSITDLSVHNRDLTAHFYAPVPLDTLMTRFSATSALLGDITARQRIDVEELHRTLPVFDLDVTAGYDNAINDVLMSQRTRLKNLYLTAVNDSSLRLDSRIIGLTSPSMKLDTIGFELEQEGQFMALNARVENRPGTFDNWAHVNLGGYIMNNEVGLRLNQKNISGAQGFDLGVRAAVVDSVVTLQFLPTDLTIGYKPWTVNKDNFLSYAMPTRHIDANLVMTGGTSKVEIMTQHVDGSEGQEDLNINISDIHLSDWLAINPFAPTVKGDLSADVRLREVDGALNGSGDVTLDDFYYGKDCVASMKVDFDVTTKAGGTLYARSDVYVDGTKTMTLSGALNDSTLMSPYNLDFSMIHFPLRTVNPFLPPRMAKLSGTLNGTMQISGDRSQPKFNGYLDFDSTAIFLNMTGTEYAFSDEKIPVVDNLVNFERFTVKGVNNNPLFIDGTVDISSLSAPQIDLTLKADNMQLVNSNRAKKGADIYGKAFISLDSRVHGNTKLLFVNADLRIVPPTNVTYVMQSADNTLSTQSVDDMVKFVNFTDTTAVMMADSVANSDMMLVLDASLTIENGTTIGVNLSTDGKNRAQIEADGTVNYTMSPLSSGRMTGRLDITQGYVKVSPPFMSEKNFAFDNNSYVAFNGDMMDPTLNLHAVDDIKANVTQSGQNSRLVNFDVALNVTGSLNRMDVSFDLSTEDDVTVANELQSMSPDQRANQAMNMLLYGIYTGPGTKGDASLSGNALYSFLSSQLNSWAANNIKGVDISFGIDQYNRTTDGSSSMTTSYSYQVSKSLFNDRFKIVIGGNYSTDANADENFSQNLINDISFDYYLNKGRTMYIRIFRHTGYESILEGEITQTGVGFVYRHKLNHLKDMFKFLKRKRKDNEATDVTQQNQ